MASTPKTSKRTTAADVASLAGVSQATVSYVVNDAAGQTIPEETRNRVWDAVAKLGYTPHLAARALRKGRSDTVLVLGHDVRLAPSLAQLLDGLTDALEQRGFQLVFRRVRKGQAIAQSWRDLMPAAIVAMAPLPAKEIKAIRTAGVQFFNPMDPAEAQHGYFVSTYAMAAMQAEHLIKKGYRSLGYAASNDPRMRHDWEYRFAGVADTCRKYELPEPVLQTFPLDLDAAIAALEHFASCTPKVSAICALNDEHALALLAAARKLKVQVPEELAVIGLANYPASAFAAPPLSTVQIHDDLVVTHLANAIEARVNGSEQGEISDTPLFSLLPREST